MLTTLIGCTPESLPPLGSYFDLIDRLWPQPNALQKTGRKDLFPRNRNGKPSKNPVKERSFQISLPAYIPVRNLCLDSAHDNYAIYKLCQKWDIQPFIDLNSNRGRLVSIPDSISIDGDGTPLCIAGFRMVNWGYCKQKHSRN